MGEQQSQESVIDRAKDTVDGVVDRAQGTVETVSDRAQGTFNTASDHAQVTYDAVRDRAHGTMDAISDAAGEYSKKLDQQLSNAARALKSGSAQATQAYGDLHNRTETFLDTGAAHAKATEQYLFDRLKVGVELAMEHPTTSYCMLGGAAILLLPGLRGLLYRQTLGRLRSDEGILGSAERKVKDVKERIAYTSSEAQKLDSRLSHALEQWQTGLSRTKATSKQLSNLASQISSVEKTAEKALADLRYVSKKDALALRSEMAGQLAAAQQQRRAIEKSLWGLTKKGL